MPHRLHTVALAVALLFGGCQCFVPVGEGDGGGSGGGGGFLSADAGLCNVPADCRGDAGPVLNFCSTNSAVWSCAFGRCVSECNLSRGCEWASAGCIRCDGVTECPTTALCPTMTHLHIERATAACAQYEGLLLEATSFSSRPCTWGIQWPDGGPAGVVTFYASDSVSAEFPALGGGCIGEPLLTGAIRFGLSCPACMLSVRPEVVGP
jgi:hypothetical protein